MPDDPCPCYSPWNKADPYPLNLAECVDFDYHDGTCRAELSEYYGTQCKWRGYPNQVEDEKELWKGAP